MPESFSIWIQSAASCHSAGPESAGVMPRLIITTSGMSAFSMPTEFVPTMSGFMRSSIVVSGWLTFSVFQARPVRPDCHAIENLLPGSKSGSFAHDAAFASKFGRRLASSSVTHPFTIRALAHARS